MSVSAIPQGRAATARGRAAYLAEARPLQGSNSQKSSCMRHRGSGGILGRERVKLRPKDIVAAVVVIVAVVLVVVGAVIAGFGFGFGSAGSFDTADGRVNQSQSQRWSFHCPR